jgi:N-acetylglucosamine-6-phosphate deacetylase
MNESLLISNARIILPTTVFERGWLLTEGKRISRIGKNDAPAFDAAQTFDARGLTLIPGFIDVHVHGAVGHEMMDANPDGLRAMAQFYAQHGVTGFLPSTWTAPNDQIMAALELVAELQGPQVNGATILGVHLEGPYLSLDKPGAMRQQDIRHAERNEALSYLAVGVIRLLSIAPEYEENKWLIGECVRRGVTVSVAHTGATYEQIVEAERLGVSHATHTYNAMTGLLHRAPGALGAVMTLSDIYCELIADNIHVHPAAMKLLYAAKGPHHLVLITDSVGSNGLPDGNYEQDGRTVVVSNGTIHLENGTLAGSSLTMDRGLKNLMTATGQTLEQLWQTSSLNAARSIHISDHKGSLEVGKDADMILVDSDINVHLTIAEGQVVYQKVK